MRHHESIASDCPAQRSTLRRWPLHILGTMLLFTACGCFEKSYTERMETTNVFYEHKDKLNRNLLPEWSGSGYRLRVPVGFDQIMPPEPKKPDADAAPDAAKPEAPKPDPSKTKPEESEAADDPRHPPFLSTRLPGLIATWQRDVSVDVQPVGDQPGGVVGKKAYFCLLSNLSLFAKSPEGKKVGEPADFHKDATKLIADSINVTLNPSDWLEETYPRPTDFQLPKDATPEMKAKLTNLFSKVSYRSITLRPKNEFESTTLLFTMWIHAEGPTQTILLLIYPAEVSSAEKLPGRFDFSLETLKAPANPEQGASPTAAGTAAF